MDTRNNLQSSAHRCGAGKSSDRLSAARGGWPVVGPDNQAGRFRASTLARGILKVFRESLHASGNRPMCSQRSTVSRPTRNSDATSAGVRSSVSHGLGVWVFITRRVTKSAKACKPLSPFRAHNYRANANCPHGPVDLRTICAMERAFGSAIKTRRGCRSAWAGWRAPIARRMCGGQPRKTARHNNIAPTGYNLGI